MRSSIGAALTLALTLGILPSITAHDPFAQSLTARQGANGTGVSANTTAYLRDLFSRWSIPGAVVAYVSPGKDEVLAFGQRDVQGNNVTNETFFAIASNTKLFTALAVNLLIEDKVTLSNGQPLRLDSRVKDVIPGFTMQNASLADTIRLIDIMSMRSGLPQHIITTTPSDTPLTAASRTGNLTINAPAGPNGTFQYSNHNYEVLASLPSVLVNKSIEAYVQERIFWPLGMGATYDAVYADSGGRQRSQGFFRGPPNATKCQEIITANGTAGYTDVACVGELEAFDFWIDTARSGFYGGAAINLRGVDMIKWAKELVNPTILPPAVFERLKTSVPYDNLNTPRNASAVIETVGYQTGHVARWHRGRKVYVHDGALPGANSFFAWSPDKDIGVFVAANEDGISVLANEVVVNTVLDELLGFDRYPWEESTIQASLGGQSGSVDSGSTPPTTSPSTGNNTSNSTTPRRPAPTGYANSTFSNPAYGNFTLIPFNLSSPSAWLDVGIPAEWFVSAIALPSSLNLTGPAYYAAYNQSIVSDLIFTHFDGPLFNYTTVLTRPRLSASGNTTASAGSSAVNGTTAKTYGVGPAVFGEGGIGMFGNFALQSSSLPKAPVVETGIKAAAPVFFAGTAALASSEPVRAQSAGVPAVGRVTPILPALLALLLWIA